MTKKEATILERANPTYPSLRLRPRTSTHLAQLILSLLPKLRKGWAQAARSFSEGDGEQYWQHRDTTCLTC